MNSKIKSQNQANIQKLQDTRFFIKDGLQEFKAKYEEEKKIDSSLNPEPVSIAEDPKPQNTPAIDSKPAINDNPSEVHEIPESGAAEIHPEPQTELAYDIPPEESQTVVEPNDWAHTIHMNDFLPAWEEFIDSQSVRISTLLKIVKPEIQGTDFVLTVSGRAQQEGLDSIRFPLTRYVNEKSNGKLTKVVIKLGELQEAESRPYTEKEKLEYLMKKKPVLADIIKKLELRIP